MTSISSWNDEHCACARPMFEQEFFVWIWIFKETRMIVRRGLVMGLTAVILLAAVFAAQAQDPVGEPVAQMGTAPIAQAPVVPTVPSSPVPVVGAAAPAVAGSIGQFPALPGRLFFRGIATFSPDGSLVPRPDLSGFYMSWFKVILLVSLFALWIWTASWINDDAGSLKVRQEFWNGTVLLTGVAGFLLALCSPSFFLVFLAMSLGYAVPMGIYVTERNQRVPESGKVLTPRHLQSVANRVL
ncbi:MAG: hypothetical protein B7Z55_12515, partial [Planctomycetales bacterium 12-60-4]